MTNENPIPYHGGSGHEEDAYVLYDFLTLVKRIENQFSISFEDKDNAELFMQLCKPVAAYIRSDGSE
ncbi:MAG: hypothetical protein OXU23_00725 [Candidatus Poribacteria bacterium]|nr:hypothetical protein [Candidatus Poribacteria bacterium]